MSATVSTQNDPTYLSDVLAFADHGNRVFPVRNKRPLVEWTKSATSDAGVINAWWRQYGRPDYGWAIPENTLVIDVDDEQQFRATGLPLPQTAHQPTARGTHHVYQLPPNSPIRQRTHVVPGVDYRIGGKGYVVLYEPRMLLAPIAPAPRWPAEQQEASGASAASDTEIHARSIPGRLGTRNEILLALGKIAAIGSGLSLDAYLGMLAGWRANDVIATLDPDRPWTDDDLLHLAGEAMKWEEAAAADRRVGSSLVEKLEAQIEAKRQTDVMSSVQQLSMVDLRPPAPLLLGRWDAEGASILYGTGGVGKGRLASQEIAGLTRSNDKAVVLIVDYEDHEQEWRGRIDACGGKLDRIYRIAPHAATWTGKRGSMLAHADDIRTVAERIGATWIVIDSAMMAIPGVDVGDPKAAMDWSMALQTIGRPSLTLAHVTKADADPAYPFGSVFWHNLARITWSLAENGERLVLRSRKHNNYPDLGRFVLNEPVAFGEKGGKVTVASGFWTLTEEKADTQERIANLIAESPGGLTVEEIVSGLDLKMKHATLARWLQRSDELVSDGGKPARWRMSR